MAANLDIRGFSKFAATVDSAFAMVYLRKVYVALIDAYVPDGAFFKLTGDGLLLVQEFEEPQLGEVVRAAVGRSLDVLETFPSLCKDDPMIPFATPPQVGVGLSWGTASSLIAGKTVWTTAANR